MKTIRTLLITVLSVIASALTHAANTDARGVQLLWGGDSLNGMGIFVSEQRYINADGSEKLITFGAWFLYGLDGKPTWLTFTCNPLARDTSGRGSCTTQLIKTSGTKPSAYDVSKLGVVVDGDVTITYTSSTTGIFSYNFEGQVGAINFVPQVFGAVNALVQYDKLWWNSTQNGMGIFISEQSFVATDGSKKQIVFGAWFHYGPDGKATWLTFTGNPLVKDVLGRDTTVAQLIRTTGSKPLGYDKEQLAVSVAGNVTITFNSDREMTFAYNFDDQVGAINLVPQIFGADLAHPPKLLALIQGDSNNGYIDINLNTFAGVQKNPGGSFYGADYDEASGNIVLSGLVGGPSLDKAYLFVNPITGATSSGLNLPYQSASRTPLKCEAKSSTRAGICYYGFGFSGDGRVVIAQGRNVVETVTLPDANLNRAPRQFAQVGSTLVMSTISPFGTLDVIHRLDVSKTPRVWMAPITLPIKVTGIATKGNNLYLSGFTLTTVFKLLVVDIVSGNVKDSNLSFDYTAGIALSEDTLFFSALGKVTAYKLSDYSFLWEILLPITDKIVYFRGLLYVSNSQGNSNGALYKVDAITRVKVAELAVNRIGTGELVIIDP